MNNRPKPVMVKECWSPNKETARYKEDNEKYYRKIINDMIKRAEPDWFALYFAAFSIAFSSVGVLFCLFYKGF